MKKIEKVENKISEICNIFDLINEAKDRKNFLDRALPILALTCLRAFQYCVIIEQIRVVYVISHLYTMWTNYRDAVFEKFLGGGPNGNCHYIYVCVRMYT